MERVLIVSKTRMSRWVCVGGLGMNGNFLRLLNTEGYNQPIDTDFEIGQSWLIQYRARQDLIPPHLEDVLVSAKERKGDLNTSMIEFLNKINVPIWSGGPEVLFDGMLKWTAWGSGYITKEHGLPSQSVGFWLPKNDLVRNDYKEKIRYDYENDLLFDLNIKKLTYVGLKQPIYVIPAGTLLRVSLARWWDRNGETEERCSLQLSGFYELAET